jgi:hypothetical protein
VAFERSVANSYPTLTAKADVETETWVCPGTMVFDKPAVKEWREEMAISSVDVLNELIA